jgi:hypothetical protein
MNKTLGNTVGNRINDFDELDTQTVTSFNELFPECPIKDKDAGERVVILSPDSNNCRSILVGDTILKHKMYSDVLYTLDKEEYYLDERDTELDEINGTPV